MDFAEWSNRKKQRDDFERLSNERNTVQAAKTSTPYYGAGDAAGLCSASSSKSFNFSESPKAKITSNRFLRTETEPAVYKHVDSPLAATPAGAYTNNWLNDIDDDTLSQLIVDYADSRRNLDLAKPAEKSYGERHHSAALPLRTLWAAPMIHFTRFP